MSRAVILVGAVLACGDTPRETVPITIEDPVARLERTIASDLEVKLGRDVKVRCTPPARCTADLGDATLPITLALSRDGWTWHIDGMLVRTGPIETYLRETVHDLGADQRISCGAPIRSIVVGERIACSLERGGTAFVAVHADGSFGVEVALDRGAAAARTDAADEADLLQRSRAGSAHAGNDDDD
jgi:hypothetical protein